MDIIVIILIQSMKPFWTMSQMSTLDGSPKLERQVSSPYDKYDNILIVRNVIGSNLD